MPIRTRGPDGASNRGFAGLAGADPDHLIDSGDEDLAVADLSGARRLDDRLDRAVRIRTGETDNDAL